MLTTSDRLPDTVGAPGATPGRARIRLSYLDGLRGLAALYVVIFHASQITHGYATEVYSGGSWPASWEWLRHSLKAAQYLALNYGHYAVNVFIVLSGYCLMLPVARAGRDQLTDGFLPFIRRRAWRILPPYFIAMALSLAVILLVPGMGTAQNVAWDSALPALDGMTLLSHVLLFHHWGPWALKINSPMWSVGLEWQIYFLFPLLILPLRRRIGALATALTTFAGGVVLLKLLSGWINPEYSNPWFLGLFAMGAFAASVHFDPDRAESRWAARLPWQRIETALWVTAVVLTLLQRKSWEGVWWLAPLRVSTWGSLWPMDLLVGAATTCMIIRLTRQAAGHQPAPPRGTLRLFESAPAVRLGEFSYSLYLVHAPILGLVDLAGRQMGLGGGPLCLLALFVSVPLSVAVSYLFHLAFEKPFMSAFAKSPAKPAPRSALPMAGEAVPGRVSVIIPCHNAAGYLPRAVASVLGQTYRDVELIVVDDCSADDPAAALARFGGRVTLVRQPVNGGPSAARNAGIARATGEILAFLDADDWWPADLLERLVPQVLRGTGVVYDNVRVLESSLHDGLPDVPSAAQLRTDGTLLHDWLRRGPARVVRDNLQTIFTVPALFKLLVHRDDCAAVGGFDVRYHCGEDMHLCVKLAAANVDLQVVAEPRGFYLVRGDSILRSIGRSSDKQLQALDGWWRMFGELLAEQPLPARAAAECRRLKAYYRARYADAVLRSRVGKRDVRALADPSLLQLTLPALPGIVKFKARGLASRVRSRLVPAGA